MCLNSGATPGNRKICQAHCIFQYKHIRFCSYDENICLNKVQFHAFYGEEGDPIDFGINFKYGNWKKLKLKEGSQFKGETEIKRLLHNFRGLKNFVFCYISNKTKGLNLTKSVPRKQSTPHFSKKQLFHTLWYTPVRSNIFVWNRK